MDLRSSEMFSDDLSEHHGGLTFNQNKVIPHQPTTMCYTPQSRHQVFSRSSNSKNTISDSSIKTVVNTIARA